MNIGLIIGLGIIGFVAVIGGLWYYMKQNSYKYSFLLYTRDGKHAQFLKAKIVNDKINTKVKKFLFKNSDRTIEIREPSTTYNGRPCRQITFNDSGDYVYISDSYVSKLGIQTIDQDGKEVTISGTKPDSSYKVQEVSPQERELIARQLEDNVKKFQVMDKSQMFAMFGMLAFGILFMIGIVFVTIQFAKLPAAITEIQETNSKMIDNMVSISTNQQLTMDYLLQLQGQEGNGTITRTLS